MIPSNKLNPKIPLFILSIQSTVQTWSGWSTSIRLECAAFGLSCPNNVVQDEGVDIQKLPLSFRKIMDGIQYQIVEELASLNIFTDKLRTKGREVTPIGRVRGLGEYFAQIFTASKSSKHFLCRLDYNYHDYQYWEARVGKQVWKDHSAWESKPGRGDIVFETGSQKPGTKVPGGLAEIIDSSCQALTVRTVMSAPDAEDESIRGLICL